MYGIAIALCFVSGLALLWFRPTQARRRYPPGPRPLPIIGNLLDMPRRSAWLYLTELKQKYGDIVFLAGIREPIVVLNTYKVARDLLVSRASIYSDRPHMVTAGEILGWVKSLTLMPYGPKWAVSRKAFHLLLNKGTVMNDYANLIERETREVVNRIVKAPSRYTYETQLLLARVILEATYGIEPKTLNDSHVVATETMEQHFKDAMEPGAFLVDVFPSLQYLPTWLPFMSSRKKVEAWRDHTIRTISDPFDKVRKEVENDTAKPCFASRLLAGDINAGDAENMKWLCGVMYAAGTETSVPAVTSFILAMTLHPEIQAKGQAEVDHFVGSSRLPTLADKEHLPYLECIVKEVMRWHPILPMSIPYSTMADDEYNGYFIPKGSTIFANSWAMSRDEAMFPNPEEFYPERFEGHPEITDPRLFVFGVGRRICPGIPLAEAVLWNTIATFLATTHISKALDDDGNEIVPPIEYTSDIISWPKHFPFAIRWRTQDAAALVSDSRVG